MAIKSAPATGKEVRKSDSIMSLRSLAFVGMPSNCFTSASQIVLLLSVTLTSTHRKMLVSLARILR